jgi:hypothetical protein
VTVMDVILGTLGVSVILYVLSHAVFGVYFKYKEGFVDKLYNKLKRGQNGS